MRYLVPALLLLVSACGTDPGHDRAVDATVASARLEQIAEAIDEWAPDNNTFPSLPSHPMRIVGWATLAQSATFAEAIEYSGHADIHVDATRDALSRC